VDNIQETVGIITPIEAVGRLPVVASDWDGYRSDGARLAPRDGNSDPDAC